MCIYWLVFVCFSFVWAETRKTSIQLNKLNSSLAQLQSNVDHLQANVTAVKSRISETLSNPNCTGCDNLKPELQKLTLDISITVSTDFV